MTERHLARAIGRAVGVQVSGLTGVGRMDLGYDAFLAGRTVARVFGQAATPGGPIGWSLIEKATEGPATASPYLYDNALREFRAYESELLSDLAPSVVALSPLGLQQGEDGSLTVWLEDLATGARPLGHGDLLDTARHLGGLAGRWLGCVPWQPWLFTGWMDRHGQPQSAARDVARLRAVRSRPEVERRLGWDVDWAIRLIEAQPAIASALETMPQTLCHHDAVGANVFRRGHGRGEETVLIDWEMVGPGAVGADLVSLLFSSARRGDLRAHTIQPLVGPALAAYRDGMREVGAAVDGDVLRRSFRAAVALRWALARDVITALDDGSPVRRGSAPDESPEQALEELIVLTDVLREAAADFVP